MTRIDDDLRQRFSALADRVARIEGRLDERVKRDKPDSPATPDRILWNVRDGDIDEIVMSDVDIHIEQMTDRCWWIGVTSVDGHKYWAGNFTCDSRGRMTFTEQERDFEWDVEDAHEEKP